MTLTSVLYRAPWPFRHKGVKRQLRPNSPCARFPLSGQGTRAASWFYLAVLSRLRDGSRCSRHGRRTWASPSLLDVWHTASVLGDPTDPDSVLGVVVVALGLPLAVAELANIHEDDLLQALRGARFPAPPWPRRRGA